MDQNSELLMNIYKSAELERAILGRLIRRTDDNALRVLSAEQFAVYHNIMNEAHSALNRRGILAQEYSGWVKRPIYSAIAVHLRIDDTSSHIAEMLVRGNLTGLIDIARALHEAKNADEDVRQLGERLKEAQIKHLSQMLDYV